ncbi:MAG: pyridoxal-dependent decarboxylase, exosortase A system-associated [Parashewanella sp.]
MNNQHVRLADLDSLDNRLVFAGKPVDELVGIAGQTPCYIYDRQQICQRISSLKQQLPQEIELHYAIKANPMPAVVHCVAPQVDGLDVASHKELLLALSTGIAPERISCAGPGKSIIELTAAISSGVTINVESVTELERIYNIAHQVNKRAQVAFRVNPEFELKSSGMKMAGGPKQFGIDSELLPDIISCLNEDYVEWVGLHIFSGSQNLSAEALMDAHNKKFELAAQLAQYATTPLKHINIGGGFGIPYFSNETELEINPIANNLSRLLATRPESLKTAKFIIELGRYLVGEAGVYLSRVTDKKISRGSTYIVTDGGLHHHLANSGNFGQVIRKNYPLLNASRLLDFEQASEKVEIVGPLCTPLDIIGAKVMLPRIEVGDLIAVFQSGAYGATASPQQFLSQPDIVELLI